MNNDFLQKDDVISVFYNIPKVKSKLESDDPVRGAFDLAYSECGIYENIQKSSVKNKMFEVISNWYTVISADFENYLALDYDANLLHICNNMITYGKTRDLEISFGQAQLIVNKFFKYLLLVDEKLNRHLDYFHVPLDSVLLNKISNDDKFSPELRKYAKNYISWLDKDSAGMYLAIQHQLREVFDCPIIFEFKAHKEQK